MEIKHTPTPWSGGHYSSIVGCPVVGQGGTVICNTAIGPKPHKESAEANAAFILRACNTHDELMAAAKAVLETLRGEDNGVTPGGGYVSHQAATLAGAIAKAEGKQ